MPSRKSIDEYYLDIAKAVSERSTCLRIHYGAVIVKNNRIISTGYNGAASGFVNCDKIGICIREKLNIPHGERYELCRSVHAEQNAIIQGTADEMEGATLYLYGEDARTKKRLNYSKPCDMCRRTITNAKIKEIVSYDENDIVHDKVNSWSEIEYLKFKELLSKNGF